MIFILYVYILEHIYVCKSPRKSQEELDPRGLVCELPCICVPGSKTRASVRTLSTIKPWAISLAPRQQFVQVDKEV